MRDGKVVKKLRTRPVRPLQECTVLRDQSFEQVSAAVALCLQFVFFGYTNLRVQKMTQDLELPRGVKAFLRVNGAVFHLFSGISLPYAADPCARLEL
jgi:hypothetical protein